MEFRNTDPSVKPEAIPAVLSIAGSDSGGGAGIQADLRTFTSLGTFATSAITGITAQNPYGITGIEPVSPACVAAQIKAVFAAFNIRALKTGMLYSAEIIHAVADELKDKKCPVVVDPVMLATSGSQLLKNEAQQTLTEDFLPLADWITPNIREAEAIWGQRIETQADAVRAAEAIAEKFDTCVVVKGGHLTADKFASDIVCTTERTFCLSSPRLNIPESATHGTGCTFSAALAAALAQGQDDITALIAAKGFVFGSLANLKTPGKELCAMYPPENPAEWTSKIFIGEIA